MRQVLSILVGIVIGWTGFRFSTDYRHGVTRWSRAVYSLINTVQANFVAERGVRAELSLRTIDG